ncbi:MAG: carboxypeptidase-like regulatory domain-containing protein [Tahibacter sp.]
MPVTAVLDSVSVAKDFMVLRHKSTLYVPLLNTASLLSLIVESPTPSRVTGSGGLANFSLDADSEQAVIDGKTLALGPDEILVIDEQMWVSVALVAKLLPIRVELDLQNLVLQLVSTRELPLTARLRRDKEHAALTKSVPAATAIASRHAFPYRVWGLPSGDLQLLTTSSGSTSQFGLRALLTGDLAFLNAALFLGASERGLDEVRLRLTRESVDGDVFGWPPLTRAEFGDVYATNLPLVGSARGGRGFTLSSFPLDQQTEFDATRIEGDAPPGWQVEVYGNGQLLGFQQVSNNGRYLFERLPVLFGENQYRLTFYGPGGERREEFRHVRVGADRIPAGEWRGRMSAHQPGSTLLGIGRESPGNRAPVASIEMRYGVLEWLTLGGFLARAPTSSEPFAKLDDFAGGIVRASLGNVSINLDVVAQANRRVGGNLGFITQIAGTSVSARLSDYRGLTTPESTRGGALLDREIFVRLNRPLTMTWLHGSDIGLEITRDDYLSGREETRLALVLRQQIGGISFEHELQQQRLRFDNTTGRLWQLRSAATFHLGSAHLRAQLAAREGGVDGINLSGQWSIGKRSNLGFNYSRQMEGQEDDVSAYFSRDFIDFTGRIVGGHSDTLGNYASVELSISFAFDQSGHPRFSSRRLASGGLAEPLVFLDRNNNGRFDPLTDEPQPGAVLRVDDAARPGVSDASGHVFLDSLPTFSRTDLSVDPRSLRDPFFEMREDALSFQARPGTVFRAEFPVIETGSIEGHVYRIAGTTRLPLQGARMELVDGEGHTAARAASQIDGYYVFERVKPGLWSVRVSANTRTPAERKVSVTRETLQINNVDFTP